MSVDFRSYVINSGRPLVDAKPAAWGADISSSAGGDTTTGGTGGLFWKLMHNGSVISTLTKLGILKVGSIATASLPTASAAGAGAIVYDTTAGKLKVSNGTAWQTITSA